ncbi:MAG: LamG domain-containing protein, partial [Candidatus Omnitrophota bacterium]
SGALGIIGSGVVNSGGNVDISTSSPLVVDGDVTASGNISLAAGETPDDVSTADSLTVNADIISELGNILLSAGDDITQNTGSTIQTQNVGNTVTLLGGYPDSSKNSRGNIEQNGNAQILTNNGDVDLTAWGDVKVGYINAGTGAATIASASGAIIDNGDIHPEVIAKDLTLSAAKGIGSGNALETKVSNLQATNTASEDIQIHNTGPLSIIGSGVHNVGGGLVNIWTGSPMDVLSDVISAGNVVLTASGDNLNIGNNANVRSTAGNVYLTADNNISMNSGTVQSNHVIDLAAVTGGIEQSGGQIGQGTESITLDANQNVKVSNVQGNDVWVRSVSGGIADYDTLSITPSIISKDLYVSAATGIDLKTQVANILGKNTLEGDILIDNIGKLTIYGLTNQAENDLISVKTDNDLLVRYNIESAGDILLDAYKNIYLNTIADISAPEANTITLNAQTGEIALRDIEKEAGLVGYWNFDETTTDVSGNGNDGIVNGGAGYVSGQYGEAIDFDGIDDYVDMGTNFSFGTGPFTILLWYKGMQSKPYAGLAGATPGSGKGYTIENHNGHLRSWVNNDVDDGSLSINNNQWHQLAMSRSGATGSLYVDGNGDNTGFATSGLTVDTTDNNFWVGGWGDTRYLAKGAIDDVRVYNRDLSSLEIKANYEVAPGAGIIKGGNLIMSAATGIGSNQALKTEVSTLQASNSTLGNINVNNTGDLTVAGSGIQNDAVGGQINVNAASSIDINSAVNSNGGDVNFTATENITHGANGKVVTKGGNYTGNAASEGGVGAYTINSGATINTDKPGAGKDGNVKIIAGQATWDDSNLSGVVGGGDIVISGASGKTVINPEQGTTYIATGNGNIIGDNSVATQGNALLYAPNGNIGTATQALNTKVMDLAAVAKGLINIYEHTGLTVAEVGGIKGLTANDSIKLTVGDHNGDNLDLEELISAQSVNISVPNGKISDKNGAANNIAATDLTISAKNDIGSSSNSIETAVENLTASSAKGGIYISEADFIRLMNITASANNINIAANGSIDVDTISNPGGKVTLTSATGDIHDTSAPVANITTKDLYLSAVGGNIYNLTTNIDNLWAEANNITLYDIGSFTAQDVRGNGISGFDSVNLTAYGDLYINYVYDPLDVTLVSQVGTILDANGDGLNVETQLLSLAAANGIDLDTAVSNLAANNSGKGDIDILNTGSLTVTTVKGTSGVTNNNGNVTLKTRNNGDIKLKQAITANGKTVSLDADGAIIDSDHRGDDIIAKNAELRAKNGIGDGNDIDTKVSNLAAYNSAEGDINVENTGNLTITKVGNTTGVRNNGGDVKIKTHSNLILENNIVAEGDTVTLDIDGAVIDNHNGYNDIVADALKLLTVKGMGKSDLVNDTLETQVNDLAANNSGKGDIDILNTGSLTVTTVKGTSGVTNNNGNVTLKTR